MAYPLDHRIVIERHLADGIDTIWNLPYARRAGTAAALNAAILEISRGLTDDRMTVIAGCTVHPADDDPVGDLRAAIAAGARVVKLHCSVGEYEIADARLHDTLVAAGDEHVPVVVHAGHSVAGVTEADEVARLAIVAAACPATTRSVGSPTTTQQD